MQEPREKTFAKHLTLAYLGNLLSLAQTFS
jgi:hypothetical protein